ncbi:MAG: EutP/PduV family microcompartment system protein [Deltaproteobacteria bacterium]|jgi:ethanolamine utilization protein EutP|nr:EutP/PduV family microcompartment system protein [Deltaproteobacteria bacterium]
MTAGPVACGKSTLLAALGLGPDQVRKTEALTYNGTLSIDTPGEMLSIPRFYNALILNSYRASLVMMVMDGGFPIWLPSRLCLALKAPTVGVVSKIDLATPQTRDKAKNSLKTAGVEAIFEVSALTGQGLKELKEYLKSRLGP